MTIILHVGKSNKMTAFIYYTDSGFLCVDSFAFKATKILLVEESWNLLPVFLMYLSKYDRNIAYFPLQLREKGVTCHISQEKWQERVHGPSPTRTPTNILKIDQNRMLYINRK